VARVRAAVVVLLAALPALAGPRPTAATDADPPDFTLRARRECGLNSLYVLLRLCGHPVQYERLKAALAIAPNGSSLLQLRDAARVVGARTAIGKGTLEDLTRTRLPVLAHLDVSPFYDADRNEPYGHFVVVLGREGDDLRVLDGSFGMITLYPLSKFAARWSGHVLTYEGTAGLPWQPWAGVLAVIAGWLLWRWQWRAGRTQQLHTNGVREPVRLMLLMGVVAGCAGLCRAGSEADSAPSPIWRQPRQNGANALYLFLRLHHRPVSYAAVEKALPAADHGHSLLQLRDASRQLGLPAGVYKCRPDDLARGPLPVVALLDNPSGTGGTFVVLLNQNGGSWFFLNAVTATVEEMSADEFRRRWSGSVLVRRAAWPPWVVSLGGSLVVLAAYGLFVWRRWTVKPPTATAEVSRT
jgi:hypothetical protein